MRIDVLTLSVLTAFACFAIPRADAQNVDTLDTPVERTIAKDEHHEYVVPIDAGHGLKVVVDQLGADVEIALDTLIVNDASKRRYGRELLVWLAQTSGSARIRVRASSVIDAGGRYRVTVSRYAPSDALTRAMSAYADGLRLLDDASRANASGADTTAIEAADRLQQAADAWRDVGDRELRAACLYRLGRLLATQLQRPADALPLLNDALAFYDEAGSGFDSEIGTTLNQIASVLRRQGQYDGARAAFERAIAHASTIDPLNRAVLEDNFALALMAMGEFDGAIASAQRAIETFRSAGARRDEAIALERLALTFSRLGRFDEALARITDAIALGREAGKGSDLSSLHASLGRIHAAAGDNEAALAAYQRALDVLDGPDAQAVRATIQLSIGRVHNRLGDYGNGRAVLERALSRVPSQFRDLWAATATELGVSLAADGELSKALDLQKQALDIFASGRVRFAELAALRNLASTARAVGDPALADRTIVRMREIAEAMPGRPHDALVLREEARNAILAGDLPRARQRLDEALTRVEGQRSQLQSQAMRTSFGITSRSYYEDAIDIAMRMHARAPGDGHDVRAFELFERSRARSLAELLAASRADVRAGVDPALATEQRALQQQLDYKDAALREAVGSNANPTLAAALEREVDDLARRLTVLDMRLRSSNPRYAALTQPAPASLRDTQRLLDEDTVLVAWSIGAQSSWGWAITRESVRSFELPPAARIDALARTVYAGITARQRRDRGVAAPTHEDTRANAAALSDLVLGPIAEPLANEWASKRLAVIATGALEYVPLAALPMPSSARLVDRPSLIDTHEVVLLPSASVLALLRDESASRRSASAASARAVAVIADPVYTASDPRVRQRTTAPSRDLASSDSRPSQPSAYGRLLFSRQEAAAIARLARPRQVLEALDFDASVQTMAGPAVANARVVHIATHGILDSTRPELSGLVFSLVDRHGLRQPGTLRLFDVLDLTLSADLVVLSGCQTGLGRQITGEGLVGLSRAFMYAGARRIVASLWQVDDLATAELMRGFYRALLVRNMSPASALRAAQSELRANPRWRAPFYWAGFTLLGDWRDASRDEPAR